MLFRIHLSMIYAFVPRSTGTRMCILHRPCHDLRVRTAFHTVRCCCENHILRRSSQVRTGTIIFVPVRIHYFAYAFQRFSAFIPPRTGAKIIRLTPCHELLSARTSLDYRNMWFAYTLSGITRSSCPERDTNMGIWPQRCHGSRICSAFHTPRSTA